MEIISKQTLLDKRRAATVEEEVPFRLFGKEETVTKKIANGEMETYELSAPAGELMTTPAGSLALVQKTVLDVEQGRERTPLLYQPIYRNVTNRAMSRDVRVPTSGRTRAVFLEHLEGEEVKFGTRTIGAEETIPILTYATGMQWTEDMEEFDLNWEAEEANQAIGEAYNALLNHLHLFPIINYTYSGGNVTAYDTVGTTQYEKDRNTIKQAIEEASLANVAGTRRGRNVVIALAHPSLQFRLSDAMQARQINGTQYPSVGGQIQTIILYDGWSETVGEKTYDYAGCPTNAFFLIEPRRWFVELVKHDLLVDAGNPDLSRLIKEQIVGRARRGVYAAPGNGVQKVELA